MKRVTAFFLAAVFALLLLTGCGAGIGDAAETAVTTEEPEVFASATLIQGGVSDYVIVHDGTSDAKTFANALRTMIAGSFGVSLEVASAKDREESGCEIVVGEAREIAQKTLKKLIGEFDFALKVEQDKLVLCAKDALSYSYLSEYLKREVLVKSDSNDLVLDSDDNIVYSGSSLTQSNYIDYWLEQNSYFPLSEIFAWKQYRNADTTLPYRIYIPFNYSPDKSYPLLVNLHGAGLRGSDNEKQLKFIDTLLKMPELPLDDAIIIFPQCPETDRWVDTDWSAGSYSTDAVAESDELKAVVELIGQLQGEYSIDENRIYACGFSMGGYGTWDLLARHSDLFCAGVAMCGAGDPSKADILKDIPIWAVHGAKDPTVPVSGSQDMVEAIKASGGEKINYTELADNEHDVWSYTYSSYEIFSWLFSQNKA